MDGILAGKVPKTNDGSSTSGRARADSLPAPFRKGDYH